MADPVFEFRHPVTGKNLGTYEPVEWGFNDPLFGAGSCAITLQPNRDREVEWMRRITETDQAEITAWDGDQCVWGGTAMGRTWNRNTRRLSAVYAQWETYLYSNGPSTPLIYNQKTETAIVLDWIAKMNAGSTSGFGIATIGGPGQVGSQVRDVTVPQWRSWGDALDNLGTRDGGFEWSIGITRAGKKTLKRLRVYEPRASRISSNLIHLSDEDSVNRATIDEWPEDGSESASLVWATDQNQYPEQMSAYSRDPILSTRPDYRLQRQAVTSWSGVKSLATLSDHARAVQRARNVPTTMIPVSIPGSLYSLGDYAVGDRVRLRVKDEWVDVDFKEARIFSREVKRSEGSDVEVKLQINISDITEPSGEDA